MESLASAINTAEVRGLSTFHGFLYLFFSRDFCLFFLGILGFKGYFFLLGFWDLRDVFSRDFGIKVINFISRDFRI